MAAAISKQLLETLATIDRPDTVCASGCLPQVLPGLEVAGAGSIAVPLGKTQADELKKRARQAPYGKGTETLVDTQVRRVWEVDAEQVTLANPKWQEVVNEAVEAAKSALGLEKQKLVAHLYKLLLYEKGSFFLAHRDGEKLDGMVATLVIGLPSPHEGGELVVRHEGREETVDFAPKSKFDTQFAVFYADCEHEIRPVTSGYRLALVYNLTLEKSKRKITAPSSHEAIAGTAKILTDWVSQTRVTSKKKAMPARSEDEEDDDADKAGSRPQKLAVLLDHKYTKAGLDRDILKGIDRAKAEVLFAAAKDAGCEAALALVTYWVNGAAESGGYHRYGRRRRYDYDYDEENEDEDDGEHEMGEVYDFSLTAEDFSDADGHRLTYSQISLRESEIVSKKPLTEGKPDKEEYEGYTGNAGMTLDHWYHRAAILLWPTASRFDVLCQAGMTAAVGGLETMLRQWTQAKKAAQEPLKEQCLEFARRIIANWPEVKTTGYSPLASTPNPVLLKLLVELAEPALISAYIRGVLAKDVTIDPGKILGDVCKEYGWTTFQGDLLDLFKLTSNESLGRHARLLADFSLRKDKNADRLMLCRALVRVVLPVVLRWKPEPRPMWNTPVVNVLTLLPPLVLSLIALDETELFEQLITFVLEHPSEIDLKTVQIPVLLQLHPWLTKSVKRPIAPLNRWLTAVRLVLEVRVGKPPQEPVDWWRESDTGCKCADCRELIKFLSDPNKETARFPLASERRRHIHSVVDQKRLDTTHVTERRNRPFTLVCAKTKASYQRALEIHKVDLDQLAKIRSLIKGLEQ